MAYRTLIATMGYDERHVLPSLRLLPYDRLVLVAGRETFRSAGFRRLKVLEPGLRTVRVDPFDLTDALEAIRGTIRRAIGDGSVRISASGGTKILTNAAILAAFQEGVEAWYCDPDPVRLPVLRGVSLAAAFSPAEGAIALALHGPIGYDRLVAAVVVRGFARRTVLGAIRTLAAKGLIELDRDDGTVVVRPSPRFALFRDHLRAVPKKA
ncbi:MAG: hypothetical protein E6K03_07440 [Methanobacteriota archaeon]|nr:MAG: hypothetical protein E6K03_07440 [Euryarchaeota archaeon]